MPTWCGLYGKDDGQAGVLPRGVDVTANSQPARPGTDSSTLREAWTGDLLLENDNGRIQVFSEGRYRRVVPSENPLDIGARTVTAPNPDDLWLRAEEEGQAVEIAVLPQRRTTVARGGDVHQVSRAGSACGTRCSGSWSQFRIRVIGGAMASLRAASRVRPDPPDRPGPPGPPGFPGPCARPFCLPCLPRLPSLRSARLHALRQPAHAFVDLRGRQRTER